MFKLGFAILVAFSCQIASAQGSTTTATEVSTNELIMNINDLVPNHRWAFLDCVHDRHDCQHHASQAGYHHFYAVHDHNTCHHDHHNEWACYVRE